MWKRILSDILIWIGASVIIILWRLVADKSVIADYVALFAILEFLIPGNIFASPGESACPDKPVAGSPTTSPGYSGQPVSIPMATVQGEESPGTIECPKNANYEYRTKHKRGNCHNTK